jgi:hypothetical protein
MAFMFQEETIEVNGEVIKFGKNFTNSDGAPYGQMVISHSDQPGRYWDMSGNPITRETVDSAISVQDLFNSLDEPNPNYSPFDLSDLEEGN